MKVRVLFRLVVAFYIAVNAASGKPNIVFILADDLGFNDVGYHGSEIYTPILDRLASQGVKLENYYSQPICTPSRASFLSGRYNIRNGMHGNIRPSVPKALPTDSLTLADKLKQAGYSTHCVGKWHLGFYKKEFMPTNRGFDTFYGFLVGSKSHYSHRRCDRGMCGQDFRENDRPIRTRGRKYSTHLFTERAIDIIRDHDPRKPLFIYLPYQAPHSPLQVPREYEQRYSHIVDSKRRAYAGMVTALDEGVGNITQALRDKGLWGNTVLVFSSDNGGQGSNGGNNYPLRGNKGGFFEGGIKAVGFVSGGMVRRRGTTMNGLMHITDWFPTLVNLGEGNYRGVKQLDGVDQWGSINGFQRSPRSEILHGLDSSETGLFRNTFDTRTSAALRFGDMKLITGRSGSRKYNPNPTTGRVRNTPIESRKKNVWLFNITRDPMETTDLSNVQTELLSTMLDKLAAYQRNSVPPLSGSSDPQANPDLHDGFWGPWM